MKFGFGNMLLFWKLFKETGFDEIEDLTRRSPRLALIGEEDVKRRFLQALGLAPGDRAFTRDESADVVLSLQRGFGRNISVLIKNANGAADAVQIVDDNAEENAMKLGQAIFKTDLDLAVPLGRRLDWLRPAAAQQVIRATSLNNGQLALLTNLSGMFPIIGPFVGATADLLLLTKNQLLLVYKLAAINSKALGSRKMIFSEIFPVLGSAFVWRTVAREISALAPFGLAIVPKVSIAFAGTYVVGMTANYYYMTGKKPPAELAKQFYRDAALQAKKLLPRRNKLAPGMAPLEQPVLA